MNTFPDLNNLPPVTDNVAIHCEELDEEIENNDENVDNLKPVISILFPAADNTSYHTKTAKLLEHDIGANMLIAEFDSKPQKLRVNPNSTIYLQDYRNIVACLEVVIYIQDYKNIVACLEVVIYIQDYRNIVACLEVVIYIQDYRNIVARLEVVILCKYHELKYKMRY